MTPWGEGASYQDRSGPRYIIYSQELDGEPTNLITDNLVGWRNPSDESENEEGEPEHDPVNHPRHYTSSPATCECGKTIECIQIVEHMGFCLGNATKYIWRADEKGNAVEDLKKAAWYIQREIENREKSNG